MQYQHATHTDGTHTFFATWPADEDPNGQLTALFAATRDRIGSLLQALPDLAYSGSQGDRAYDLGTLADLTWISDMVNARIDGLLLVARYQHGATWGELAAALDKPRSTTVERCRRAAERAADQGVWFTADGRHTNCPHQAHDALDARSAELAAGEDNGARL